MTATAERVARSVEIQPAGERYFRHPGYVVRLVLWASVALLLVLLIVVATSTSGGATNDLGRAAARLPRPGRRMLLAGAQVATVVVPLFVIGALLVKHRYRRLAIVGLAAVAGTVVFVGLDALLDLSVPVGRSVTVDWITSVRYPPLGYLTAAVAAGTVGKPWLSRSWRRATAIALIALGVVMGVTGVAGTLEILLAAAAGAAVGAALLVALGAPNRRPSPASVAAALADAGAEVVRLSLRRSDGGRSQLYVATLADGTERFVKVFAQDSRDADLLYRGYRTLLFRGPTEGLSSLSLANDVEHEALLLLLSRRAGVTCPDVEVLTALPDGSRILALEDIDGPRLDEVDVGELDGPLLDAVWYEVAAMHRAKIAHRALHPGNIVVSAGRPVLLDFGSAEASAPARLQAIDRAELLASSAVLVGAQAAVASAKRVIDPVDLAASVPYLQPLALSASTRSDVSKSLLNELRDGVAEATGVDTPPLEQLVRVRPRTILTIITLAGAFYLLLPQLADVGDSFRALRTANWAWLAACVAMSALTYVASTIGLMGGVAGHLPFFPMLQSQFASSFVNRVTPANVGGMALNTRFMQKAGIDPARAVTGIGLNVLAGGMVHALLLIGFFAWAGRSSSGAFALPASSKLIAAIAVVLALVGIFMATARGRLLVKTHLFSFARRSWTSMAMLARSPIKLLGLFGGSFGVTLAYTCALAAAAAAYDGDVSFAQVGAVYLGSSVLAAAAPTPGGLGAMEAALVAGFTGVGMDPGIAVATVLSYRLATYWLPVVPGWLAFQLLERRNLI